MYIFINLLFGVLILNHFICKGKVFTDEYKLELLLEREYR